mmetsp:Transcript_41482/g.96116  ORF Transcript_41482/g.96116 Transcript_41482/m.96116 type:complete len:94 (-) Transcript_41482:332-613(-)
MLVICALLARFTLSARAIAAGAGRAGGGTTSPEACELGRRALRARPGWPAPLLGVRGHFHSGTLADHEFGYDNFTLASRALAAIFSSFPKNVT